MTTVWQALKSRSVILLAVMTFFNYFANYSFYFWFPTMLKRQLGLSDLRVGLLGVLPYAAAFAAMQVNGWHSDKHCERRWHSAIPMFMGAAGFLCLISQTHTIPLAMAFFVMAAMTTAYLPTFWAIPTEILSQSAAAAAVGLINAVGSAAGFAGPVLFGYLNTRTGSFSSGLALMMVAAIIGGVLILCTPRKSDTPDRA